MTGEVTKQDLDDLHKEMKESLKSLKEDIEKGFIIERIPNCDARGVGEVPGAMSAVRTPDGKTNMGFKINEIWYKVELTQL